MIEYLQSHLPFTDELLINLTFLDPNRRTSSFDVTNAGRKVAMILNRFSYDEKSRIYEKLAFYEAMLVNSVPKFEKAEKDRVDDWWVSGVENHQG